jgi:putative redox protein
MKIRAKKIEDDYILEAKGASGVPVLMDNKNSGNAKGTSPMELLLMGVAGCSAIDIIYILKKQNYTVKEYEVEVDGETTSFAEAKRFKSMQVSIHLTGEIPPEKVARAAALSFDKYCSVAFTMRNAVEIDYTVRLNNQTVSKVQL